MGTRLLNRISPTSFAKLHKPGRYCDGGGLLLQVSCSGARSWIFRFQLDGRKRDMGLGTASSIGLADARQLGAQCRAMVAKGIDPIEEQAGRRQQRALKAASALTFQECALKLIEAKRPSWRNTKHAEQWERSLATHAFPRLGNLPVTEINTDLVLKVLEPIWLKMNPTAARLRERIEAVLDAAKARGQRQGENPARWRGHLENLLAKPSKIQRVIHHPALPYSDINGFMTDLCQQEALAARAMEVLIFTATRTSETLNAEWFEFDLDRAVWTVPAVRIKAGKEHRIPLSSPAMGLLQKLHTNRTSPYVFPGRNKDAPLCKMAFHKLLARMGRTDITTHGFRSTFRDWAAEQTNFPREVAEMALAHAIENKVEAAYRRGGLFEKRTKLMTAWAQYCSKPNHKADILLFTNQATSP